MIKKVHQHIVHELQQSTRTDTIFVLTAILFNLIVLAINSGIASSATSKNANASDDFILIIFMIMTLVVNFISIKALMTGKNTREKLLQGLVLMYQDNQVAKYYDATLLANYDKRYFSFTVVILSIAFTSIVVPLVIRFL
ncbi:hypothetical protein L0128_19495 [candidate division KSB1 bacterium]|nr:hypothetical protein [candidate division KSB1 bacterium]